MDALAAGQSVAQGLRLYSADAQSYFECQPDGNLVMYTRNGTYVFDTATYNLDANPPYSLTMLQVPRRPFDPH